MDNSNYIVGGGGADNGVALGAFLELILIIANIGTAVVLISLLKRQHESSRSATSRLASWNAFSSSSASVTG